MIALNMSLIIKHDKANYYRMFQETNAYVNCGDLGLFVTEFLRIIETAARDTVNYLKKQAQLYNTYLGKISQLPQQDKLMFSLFLCIYPCCKHPLYINTTAAAKLLAYGYSVCML